MTQARQNNWLEIQVLTKDFKSYKIRLSLKKKESNAVN